MALKNVVKYKKVYLTIIELFLQSHHKLAFGQEMAPFCIKSLMSFLEYPNSSRISIVFSPISGSGTFTLAMAGDLESLGAGTYVKKEEIFSQGF